jgi:mannose-6-phosphate isomerase-like protein (cupin superfamily)
MSETRRRFFVREAEVEPYSPANHTGTVNRRLIGPETVGAQRLEMVLGRVQPSHGALPHSHPGVEQVCYILSGRALAEVGGERAELGPGDCCFFPADEPHVFTATGEEEVRVLVVYSPPYLEAGARE